jgi:hypothetical protein
MPNRSRSALALLASAAIVAALFGAAAPAAAAEGDMSWGVQPSTPSGPDGRSELSYQVAPGTVVSDWVAVTNYSPVAATFRVYAADAVTDYDTAAFTLINADEASTETGAWTSVDGANAVCGDTNDDAERACAAAVGISVTLEPGARADVPFTLAVPQDATPGDHAAGVVASYVSDAAVEGGAAVAVEQRVGTRIYLRVDGSLSPGVGVQGTVASYDSGLNPIGGAARAGFDVSNLGNTRVSVQPEVRLTGPFGIGLGSFSLPPVQNIVPGGTAHVEAEMPGVPPLFFLSAEVTLTAIPAAGIASGDPLPAAVTSSAVAWAMPWMLLSILLAIVAIAALMVWRRRRSRQRLAEDLAAYTDRIREEERAAASGPSTSSETEARAAAEPVDASAGERRSQRENAR